MFNPAGKVRARESTYLDVCSELMDFVEATHNSERAAFEDVAQHRIVREGAAERRLADGGYLELGTTQRNGALREHLCYVSIGCAQGPILDGLEDNGGGPGYRAEARGEDRKRLGGVREGRHRWGERNLGCGIEETWAGFKTFSGINFRRYYAGSKKSQLPYGDEELPTILYAGSKKTQLPHGDEEPRHSGGINDMRGAWFYSTRTIKRFLVASWQELDCYSRRVRGKENYLWRKGMLKRSMGDDEDQELETNGNGRGLLGLIARAVSVSARRGVTGCSKVQLGGGRIGDRIKTSIAES
ncbi:hypothetical protein DFH08DRAFT_828043 [Mycena albidolilacea]|uniref:Uncharacterized protein n=1 Tax=Mycena albidolilacea TaxID=1033008 RepID=A0AAD6YWW8_9AGAR|nr:hypothetical protein DFH08DRAFT_828043 [Mycena albidolilacea]